MKQIIEEIMILSIDDTRLSHLTKQLDSFDLDYKIFSGFNKKNLKNHSFNSILRETPDYIPDNKSKFKVGHLCVTMAHISMINYAKTNGSESILVFEDDAQLAPDFLERIKYLNEVPDDADIIFLGALTFDKNHLIPKYKITEHVYKLRAKDMWGVHAYIVPKKSYDKVIEVLESFEDVVDDLLFKYIGKGVLKAYEIVPWMVCQEAPHSLLDKNNKGTYWSKTLYSPDGTFENVVGFHKPEKPKNIKLL